MNKEDLLKRISIRLAEYCDALGFDDEDIYLLEKTNEILGYTHINLEQKDGMSIQMPQRRYVYLIQIRLCKKNAIDTVMNLAGGSGRVSPTLDIGSVEYEWINDGIDEPSMMETGKKEGKTTERALKVTCFELLDEKKAMDIVSMALGGKTDNYSIDLLFISRLTD